MVMWRLYLREDVYPIYVIVPTEGRGLHELHNVCSIINEVVYLALPDIDYLNQQQVLKQEYVSLVLLVNGHTAIIRQQLVLRHHVIMGLMLVFLCELDPINVLLVILVTI